MRIGVMLRHLGEHGGGVDVYTRRVLDGMLRQPGDHEFVFLYRDPDKTGSFAHPPRPPPPGGWCGGPPPPTSFLWGPGRGAAGGPPREDRPPLQPQIFAAP